MKLKVSVGHLLQGDVGGGVVLVPSGGPASQRRGALLAFRHNRLARLGVHHGGFGMSYQRPESASTSQPAGDTPQCRTVTEFVHIGTSARTGLRL